MRGRLAGRLLRPGGRQDADLAAGPVTEPVTEPAEEPVTEPAEEPVTEPAEEPVAVAVAVASRPRTTDALAAPSAAAPCGTAAASTGPPVDPPADAVAAAWDALGCVYDPELCLDVVSLGLVYDIRDQDGTVVVEMTLTTPGCPASESLPAMARQAVADALAGTVEVDVQVVWEPAWTPAMMSDEAVDALGFGAR